MCNDTDVCPRCGSKKVSEQNQHKIIHYGDWGQVYNGPRAEIPVIVPVGVCLDCKLQWTDYRSEEIIDAAVLAFIPNPQKWIVNHNRK